MAGDAKKLQPIIIKRIKKGGHAAHGGAWKIAYADFVTAMMAFFLLMWLLGSTTDGDKKGIADYFASPMKVAMAGGSGSGDATSVLKGGGTDLTRVGGQVRNGDFEQQKKSMQQRALRSEQRRAEAARLASLQKKVEEKIEQNQKLAALKSQIKLEMTRDGLKIQIVDEQNRPMFDSGSSLVKPYMRDLLREIGTILGEVPNRLLLEGHTDAEPFGSGERGYSNWELSSDRANASRRELIAGGLPEDRMLLVQGLASSVPLTPSDPKSPANRRIAIVVMNREAEDRLLGVTRPGDEDEHEHGGDGGAAAPAGEAASAPSAGPGPVAAGADARPRAEAATEAPTRPAVTKDAAPASTPVRATR